MNKKAKTFVNKIVLLPRNHKKKDQIVRTPPKSINRAFNQLFKLKGFKKVKYSVIVNT